jgi:hypothetical protein
LGKEAKGVWLLDSMRFAAATRLEEFTPPLTMAPFISTESSASLAILYRWIREED